MEDYVTYEQAVKLKELGFDWKCITVYDEDEDQEFKVFKHFRNFNEEKPYYISAPTLTQAQKWLREVKDIIIIIEPMLAINGIAFNYVLYTFKDKPIILEHNYKAHSNYEQALSAGIDKALEILK